MTNPLDPHKPSAEFRASLKRDISRELRRDERANVLQPFRWNRLSTVLATAAGTVFALGIGLVLGTNTGYASARVQGNQQRNDLAGTVSSVSAQFGALRQELARTRAALRQRAIASGTVSQASLLAAEEELRALEISASRIDVELAQGRESAVPPQSTILGTVPLKQALNMTCSALSLSAPPAAEPSAIPVVELPEPTARTTEPVGNVLSVRQTTGGRVLVNDGSRRQVIMFDSLLARGAVVIDSTSGPEFSYGPYGTALFAYRGDSSIFAPATRPRTLLVLDGAGQVARSIALPGDSIGPMPFTGVRAVNGADSKGRLVFRDMQAISIMRSQDAVGRFTLRQPSDTSGIFRLDLEARRTDTIARVVQPLAERLTQLPGTDERAHLFRTLNPLVTVDDWAMLSNGTVAIVRGEDYHVDWVHADGSVNTTKLPFEWKRLMEGDKQRLLDSARMAMVLVRTRAAVAGAALAMASSDGVAGRGGRADGAGLLNDANPPLSGGARVGGGGSPGARVGGGGARGRSAGAGGAGPFDPYDFVPLSALPDYYPPIRRGSVLADLEGNLWILPTASSASKNGDLVYDVVNERRGLFQRVRVPAGHTIIGFGAGRMAYLLTGDRTNGFTLERTRLPIYSSEAR